MPKNIIVLADGTGNSSAKAFKTNVWRLYQALDLREPPPGGPPQQIVFYDNGVGTQNFRPLAVLGLAFGVGLARNVRRLYRFLCRNYEPGDGIFLFGFSRGAFTVRILSGLILRCGLVVADNEAELDDLVELTYAEYKRDAARRATATRPRLVSGLVLRGRARGVAIDRIEVGPRQHFPRISFIGVWDTVDAYGMPVDELKMAIDQYVWPMTLADRKLSQYVDRACHALSLDDERPTFRPVLWTEAPPPPQLTQVWFAGVHANVGGGYPDDALAYHALQWMMDEAMVEGLRFYPADLDEVDARADEQGPQHDSRAGVAGYYRYGPRRVDELCNDREHDVAIATPLVHESVHQRIHQWQIAYAPVSFPGQPYDVVCRVGRGLPLAPALSRERVADVPDRARDMDHAWNAVIRRRAAYLLTVTLSVWLAAFPLFDPAVTGGLCSWCGKFYSWCGTLYPWCDTVCSSCGILCIWQDIAASIGHVFGMPDQIAPLKKLTTLLLEVGSGIAGAVLPRWTAYWLKAFKQFPTLSVVLIVVVLWLFLKRSYDLQKIIFARAEWAWRRV